MLSPYMLRCASGGSVIRKMSNRAEALIKEFGSDKVYNFSIGNPRLPPPQAYIDSLHRVAAVEEDLCHGYSSTVGDLPPRQAFAELFTKIQGVQIGPEHVILTSGCAGAMNVVLRTILSPGDEVVITTPYFLEYPFYVENYQGRVVEVETTFENGWQINLEKLAAAINPQSRCVIINSPHNPTGVVYTQECIDKVATLLLERSEQYGRPIYILSDDVYARVIAPGVHCHQIFKTYPYSVVAYSLSKDISIPGERFGSIVVNPLLENVALLVHALAHANEILGFVHANRLHMRIIPDVLRAGATSEIAAYDKSREIICQMLDDCGIPYVKPMGAFYIFPRVPPGIDDVKFCDAMANHCVILVPGTGFRAPGFYRLSFCKKPEDIALAVQPFKDAYAAVIAQLEGKA
jgi:aspartate aminotransferase